MFEISSAATKLGHMLITSQMCDDDICRRRANAARTGRALDTKSPESGQLAGSKVMYFSSEQDLRPLTLEVCGGSSPPSDTAGAGGFSRGTRTPAPGRTPVTGIRGAPCGRRCTNVLLA